MKIPGFKTPAEEMATSKTMLAGFGLIGFGAYLIYSGSQEFGYAMLLNGFGYIGVKDAI
jgi:hypothetical protein